MSKIRTMQQKVFEASIYDRNSEDQRRIMDALISKRQPPGRCKTLSQVIKTLRASQMKDGSTEQGNLRREYEYKRTRSKPFPTSPFPPLASLLVVTPDVSVSRIRGLYRWDNVTSRSLITKKKQTWEDKKCAILERAITFSTTRRGIRELEGGRNKSLNENTLAFSKTSNESFPYRRTDFRGK